MSVFRGHVSFCVFILGLSFFVGTVLDVGYYHFFGPGLWQPTIFCDAPIQRLGKVLNGKKYPGEFMVKNIGHRELILRAVKPGCGGCIQIVSFPKEPIAPGKSGVVRFAFTPEKLSGIVYKGLAVISNDPKRLALILRVRAEVEDSVVARGPSKRIKVSGVVGKRE